MWKLIQRPINFLCLQLVASCVWLLASCDTIDLYEKVVPVPKHQWQSSFKPQFTFDVKDTTVPYQAFVIFRHNNKYRYNNIWVNLYATGPADSTQKLGLELPLASKEGWLGTGMDDVFEHRIRIGNEVERFRFVRMGEDGFYFTRPGQYTFSLEQIMRDDPLPEVLNIGFRLEKKRP
ncbi:MAG TPA: gliding motility lipoprotein GldH [Flavisolibacter sp.]|jgi:gliding motility-associated lipoprotein GldH|nr:gliding motility lipoprotein GldH [Flavisolibacter sp.]